MGLRITGADIRRYREMLDLTQTEFAKPLGFTQAALSNIEKGRTAVSTQHVEMLRESFRAPDFDPAFTAFEAVLNAERSAALTGPAIRGQHLTLTVWRWEEGLDLSQDFRADQAVDLVTIRRPIGKVFAFMMPKKSQHWLEGEIIVFEECAQSELQTGDLCLVHRRTPRSDDHQSLIAIAHVLPLDRGKRIQFQPVSPIGATFDDEDNQVQQIARIFFRGMYRKGHSERK